MQKGSKTQSKIYAKSMQEKGMQKYWKMMPKCIQNGSRNPLKIEKVMEKGMPKNNVEIWGQKNQILGDFAGGLGSIFGGAGEGGKLKTANTGWLIIVWHARHPGGVRRMLFGAKTDIGPPRVDWFCNFSKLFSASNFDIVFGMPLFHNFSDF